MHMHTHTHTHTHTVLRLSGFCLGLPWWAIGPLTLIEVIVVISHPLSASFISYDPWHPPCSIYVPVFSSFLINHEQWPVCCTTLLYRLVAAMFLLLCPPPPVGEQSIVVSVYVSVGLSVVSVCLSVHEHISGTICANFTQLSGHVACGCGSVLFWWHCERYVLQVCGWRHVFLLHRWHK